MGGVGGGVCATYLIRSNLLIRGCLHSKPKYDRLIATTGQGFYVKPINGVLSTLDASAGTHSRYGAVDLLGNGYTVDEVNAVARLARDQILLAYPRFWLNADGSKNWHIHIGDPSCPNMSTTLAAQFGLFRQGFDALVGNHPDPLGKYRQAEIMAAFDSKPAPAPAPAPAPVHKVDYTLPYQARAGWYPYPGQPGNSYYGPSRSGVAWYSGKVGGGTSVGTNATGFLSLPWIRGHIQRIQKCVGAAADGSYGPATVKAVQAWQAKHGLTADGITGPRTWIAMAKSHGQ